jgi:hypothetical protein
MQEQNKQLIGSRVSVGKEVLLGARQDAIDLVSRAQGELKVDVAEERTRFTFDTEQALITRSQAEGCDLKLPKRFFQVQP